jgi:uncharacterized membrane protein YccF (DUF307 family)
MRTAGNILWLCLAGFWLAIGYVMAGLINLLFIVTIPFAVQSFKLAGYALWPFGRVVVARPDRSVGLSTLGNVIWLIFGGLWLALGHLITGLVLMMTVIGFPLGVASFKMAGLAVAPFGRQIVSLAEARRLGVPVLIDFDSKA